MNIKRITGGILAVAIMTSPILASAQTASTSTTTNVQVQAMLLQIQNLQAQIKALQSAQAQVASTSASVSGTLQLIRNLRQGMSGDDVKALQAILAADPTIYQGNITGFFGSLTAEAVRKFQKKHGFEMVGSVGPKTLKKLNEQLKELGLSRESDDDRDERKATSTQLCINVPPGHLIAPGWLKKESDNKGKGKDKKDVMVFVSATTTASTTNTVLPFCKPLPPGIAKKLNGNWNPGTTTPPATTTPDTVAPVLSAVAATSTTASTTNITWTTNELATSKVWFGTSTPLNLASSTLVSNLTLKTSHSVSLSGLASSTAYNFIVISADASGNIASSSQSSFTTLAQ